MQAKHVTKITKQCNPSNYVFKLAQGFFFLKLLNLYWVNLIQTLTNIHMPYLHFTQHPHSLASIFCSCESCRLELITKVVFKNQGLKQNLNKLSSLYQSRKAKPMRKFLRADLFLWTRDAKLKGVGVMLLFHFKTATSILKIRSADTAHSIMNIHRTLEATWVPFLWLQQTDLKLPILPWTCIRLARQEPALHSIMNKRYL